MTLAVNLEIHCLVGENLVCELATPLGSRRLEEPNAIEPWMRDPTQAPTRERQQHGGSLCPASDKVRVFGVFGCSCEANRVEGNVGLISHFIVDMERHHSECLFLAGKHSRQPCWR